VRAYSGIVESHPYGLADAPGGGWYVADAAANAVLKVMPDGAVELVTVMPSQDLVATKKQAEATGLPGCVAGHTFRAEPVPTDVEVDDDGQLVVSLLPGGPEDPALGARGSVHRIDPATGEHTMVADEVATATNVALDGDTIYVTELFASKITEIAADGTKSLFAEKSTPAAVEWADGKLYATVGLASSKGAKLVAMTPEPVS
jgi:sugar lactone lactonase YvrE